MQMETKQVSCDQKLWFVAQNLETDSQIFYTIDNKQFHHQRRVVELHGRRIQACFHGWLILSDHLDGILWLLWNPPTGKLIRLPPLITKEKDYYECCLSSPPGDQGSVFLLFSATTPTISFCLLGPKRKRLEWAKMSYAKQLESISVKLKYEDYILQWPILQCPASCNGKVYAAVVRNYKFVVQVDIVVNGKEVVISLLRFVNFPGNNPWSRCPSLNSIKGSYSFLKGYCKELYAIEVCFNDIMRKRIAEVNLFKLDTTSQKWKEIVDLEDAVFFVELASGYFTCYYNSAVDSKLGGYIHVLGECGKTLYSFHVKDRTMSLSYLSCPVKESEASVWAMLEWSSEVDHPEENEGKDTKIVVRSPVKGEFDSRTGESHLLNMPLVILELIMEFCIGVEYMKFRATCKHCCLAAPSIHWSKNTKLRGYSLVSPWLMVLDNYQDTITFIDPLFGDRYFIKTPQELKGGYQIHCSKYGWLLMYKNKANHRMVFFNPFTSDIRELPWVNYMESFCFSAPPTSPDCMVVGFSRFGEWHVFIHFVSGESRWHPHNLSYNPYSPQFRIDPYSFHFSTFGGRYIYALCNNERIEAFRDMTSDGYDWMLVANKAPSRSRAQYFLSSCDQHLLLVIVGEFGGSVEVFKVNESTQEWEKIDDLGKHMIYICNTSCFCLEAKSPEMGNKIYFPRLLHDDNTKIVFYSLETCGYHTFNDKKIQESFGADLYGTKHLGHPHAWIEPSWS